MCNAVTMTVYDISEKLGVHPYTVKRWIAAGRLKASMVNTRQGYRIGIGDFEAFLKEDPVRFEQDEKAFWYQNAKIDILKELMFGLYDIEKAYLLEHHGKRYSEGWDAAIEKVDGMIKRCLVDRK